MLNAPTSNPIDKLFFEKPSLKDFTLPLTHATEKNLLNSFFHLPAVYCILLVKQNKCYVGSTEDLSKRLGDHQRNIRRYCNIKGKKKGLFEVYGCELYKHIMHTNPRDILIFPLQFYPSCISTWYLRLCENEYIYSLSKWCVNSRSPILTTLPIHIDYRRDNLNQMVNGSFIFSQHFIDLFSTLEDRVLLESFLIFLLRSAQWNA